MGGIKMQYELKLFATMRHLIITFFFGIAFSLINPLNSQDWYGAGGSGKYIVGVNASYDGEFRVGLHYNLTGNNGPFNRPLQYNIQADVGIDNGIGSIGGELGFGQIYANGNDNVAGFGLGTKLAFRYDYCQLPCNSEDNLPNTHKIGAKLNMYPGYYAQKYSLTARAELDIANLYIGSDYRTDYDETEYKNDVYAEFVERVAAGVHLDYTTFGKGRIGVHFTGDYIHDFYLSEKNIAWNTFSERKIDYGIGQLEGTYEYTDDNDVTCTDPYYNYNVRASLSLVF